MGFFTQFPAITCKSEIVMDLRRGNIIIAETWWEQNNRIVYRTKHGIMGIEKISVEKILEQ